MKLSESNSINLWDLESFSVNVGCIQFFQSPKTLQSLVSLFSFIVYNLANDFNFFTIASAKSGLNQINQIEKNLEKHSRKT